MKLTLPHCSAGRLRKLSGLTLLIAGALLWQATREQTSGPAAPALPSLPPRAAVLPTAAQAPALPPGLVADRGTPPDEAVVKLTQLPESQDVLWQQPAAEPEFAAFQQWAAQADRDAAVGVALATKRRAAMVSLISAAPARALALAVPETVRRQLPAEVAALMEERVDGRGKLEVTARFGGDQTAARTSITRRAIIGERTLEAFVYGRREDQPTRWQIPLHGIALDGKLALNEWPARVLEPVEREEARAALTGAPVCPTSQLPTASTGTEVALRLAGDVAFYCGPSHAANELRHAAAVESLLPPGFGKRSAAPVIAASGGNGITVPFGSTTADAAWTTGQKSVLFVRVKFAGVDFTDMTTNEAEGIVNDLADTYTDWSYGVLSVGHVLLGSKVAHTLVNLDHPVSEYDGGKVNDIWSEVKSKLGGIGFNADDFDFLVVSAGDAPMPDEDDPTKTVWFGGMGRIGEGLSFLRAAPNATLKTALHEVGHNLGLQHSSNIFPLPAISTLFGLEYGDVFDNMGTGWGDYNVSYKHWLHWLSSAEVPFAVSDGRYNIHEHDREEDGGIRGLQVPLTLGGFFGDAIFVEYRTGRQDLTALYNGAGLRYGTPGSPKAYLLDGTPETYPDASAGRVDSPLLPGRTFNYNNQLFITTIASDPYVGTLQIQVNHGPFPGNHAPTGTLTSDPFAGAPGHEVTFSVKATDADNDELAYNWDLGDGLVYPNSPTTTKTWPNFIGGLKITCIVSDMKGGTLTLTLPFAVNNVSPPVISSIGAKSTDEDVPLSNVPFTVTDAVTPGALIAVSATSSNHSIVPDSGIIIIPNGGGNRLLTIFPAANAHGVVTIKLTADDGDATSHKSFLLTVNPVTPGVTLVAKESTWTYWDAATEPDAGWNDDRSRLIGWKTGTARFVFNQGGLVPVPWTSLIAAPARVTTYYRRSFNVGLNVYTPMLRLLCDDGAVVYLNGVEVWRQNMPAGPIGHTTHAVLSVEGSAESEWTSVPLPLNAVNTGSNLLAVEVHEAGFARGSGDVSFDAQFALVHAPVVSGPRSVSTNEDTPTLPILFDAADSESPPGALTMRITSSNPALVADDGATFGWNPILQQHYLILTPQPDASGTVSITLKVSDGSSEGWTTFLLTVHRVNDAPRIEPLPDVVIALGAMAPAVMIKVTDVDGPDGAISVSATAANAALLPASGVEMLPPAVPGIRWLRLTPVPGVVSQTVVTVHAIDGLAAPASASFVFRVSAPVDTAGTPVSLVSSSDLWRFLVTPLPYFHGVIEDFTAVNLNDSAWNAGQSPLGYETFAQHSWVSPLPYRITTYFRRSFNVADPSAVSQLTLRLLRDDGAAVYLNGVRIHLSNLPPGVLTPSTPSLSNIPGEGSGWEVVNPGPTALAALLPGKNVLAVEVHQSTLPSANDTGDMLFDLQLEATVTAPAASHTLVPPGDAWRFNDLSDGPSSLAWRLANFADDSWLSGLAPFGYGIPLPAFTPVRSVENGHWVETDYFRKVFDVADPSIYKGLNLFVQRADGIRVFLNGTVVLLNNLSSSALTDSLALSELPANEQLLWHQFQIPPTLLLPGRNLIAAEVHQGSLQGTLDLVFDLQLTGVLQDGPPVLHLRPAGKDFELSWPAAYADWQLHESNTMQGAWPVAKEPVLLDQGWLYVQKPGVNRSFFRLEKP